MSQAVRFRGRPYHFWFGLLILVAGAILYGLFARYREFATIVLPDYRVVPLNRDIRGGVGAAASDNGVLSVEGWAIDLGSLRPAEDVVVFADGVQLGHITPALPRVDVVRRYVASALRNSGFATTLSFPPETTIDPGSEVRIFAHGSGGWRELAYGKKFRFHTRPDPTRQMALLARDIRETRSSVTVIAERLQALERMALHADGGTVAGIADGRALDTPSPIYLTQRDNYGVLDRGQSSINDGKARG